jgi:hypothetical protein
VSGPSRGPLVDRPARRSPEYTGIALGLTDTLSRLSEHRLLDRLIRGRTWIALVAFALIGIVTLQLGLLRLNSGIGHALQKEASLQRENAALSIENSELAAGDLVESSAARLGMEVVPAGALRFLTARSAADATRAAAALSAPVASSSATGEGSSGSAAPAVKGEGSSGSAAASSGPSAGAEGSGQSSESQPSTESSASEAAVSKTPSSEAGAPRASPTGSSPTTGPSPTEAPAQQSTPGSERAAAPATGGGSTEPSGGTQAGSTGR